MTQNAKYAILKFKPYPNRTEHLNYGLVVFIPQGGVRVHIASGLKKIKSMYPLANIESLRLQDDSISQMVGNAKLTDALAILNAMRVITDHKESELGSFSFLDEQEYQDHINLALNSQVEPVSGEIQTREGKSRLFIDVKSRFKALGIMAASKDRDPDHQVVTHYSPDPDADVKVEFALQNGILRIAQTIDLRADAIAITTAHKNVAYSKAYAIDYASKVLEASALESYVIVAGTHTDAAKKVMASIQRTADHVLSWESNADRESFFNEWVKAAGKSLPMLPIH
jgi:hypothetical protein